MREFASQYGIELPSTGTLVAIAAVAVLVLIGVWLLVRRIRARPTQQPPAQIEPGCLTRIYREFLNKQPRDYRRSILGFQPIVVLGNQGSGKTEVINRFSDWDQQATDGLESHTEAAELQLYLGSRVLLHELSPAMLGDTSGAARTALLRLWKPIFRRRRPIVVLVVSAHDLLQDAPDELTRLATLMRAKVNLLAALRDEPVELRIVVSHLDEFVGFNEFSAVASRAQLESRVVPGPDNEVSLDALAVHLPLSLLTAEASDYLKILEFFAKLTGLSKGLSRFIQTMVSDRGLGTPPALEAAYLTGGASGTADPLWIGDEDVLRPGHEPWRKHAQAAWGIAAGLAVYQLTGFFFEQHLWGQAREAVDNYTDLEDPDEQLRRARIENFLHRGSGPLRFFPSFVTSSALMDLKDDFSAVAMRGVIEPQLMALVRSADADSQPIAVRALYLEGLRRATNDNDLGALVRQRAAEWSRATALPQEFVESYVEITNGSASFSDDGTLLKQALAPTNSRWTSFTRWNAFLGVLGSLQERCPELLGDGDPAKPQDGCRASRARFHKVHGEASKLQEVASRLQNFPSVADLVDGIDSLGPSFRPLATIDALAIATWANETADLVEILDAVAQTADGVDEPAADSLASLAKQLRDIRTQEDGRDINLLAEYGGRGEPGAVTLTFNPANWSRYADANQVHWRLDAFESQTWTGSELLLVGVSRKALAASDEALPNSALFSVECPEPAVAQTEKCPVDPRYTRRTFVEFIQPAVSELLMELDLLESDARLSASDRRIVYDVLGRSAAAYAEQYRRTLANYLAGFRVSKSDPDLGLVLRLMASDASYFATYLHIAIDNVCFDAGVGVFEPLADLLLSYEGLCTLADVDAPVSAQAAASGSDASGTKAAAGTESSSAGSAPQASVGAKLTSPNLAEYRAIITKLADDLAGGASGTQTTRDAKTQIEKWFESVPLQGDAQMPFVAPVQTAEVHAATAMATGITDSWESVAKPQLKTLYSAYPFDDDATEDATPEQIEKALHPTTGVLAMFVAENLSDVAEISNGVLVLQESASKLPLDPSLLEEANAALKLSALFYAQDGTPRPLKMELRTRPPPKATEQGQVPSFAFLAVDEQRVLAFYQRTTKKTVNVDWTKSQESIVGLTLVDSTSAEQAVVDMPSKSMPASYFSALHLLDQGRQRGQAISWSLGTHTVTFMLRKDPRKQLSRALAGAI